MTELTDKKLTHLKSLDLSATEDFLQLKRQVIDDLVRELRLAKSEAISIIPDVQPDIITEIEGQGCPFSRQPSLACKTVLKDDPNLPKLLTCDICQAPLQEINTNVCRRCLNPNVDLSSDDATQMSVESSSRAWSSFLCCGGRNSSPSPTQFMNQIINND